MCAYVKKSVSNGGLGMCQPNDSYLRGFTFWFDTEKVLFQVILDLLLLSISVCRLRERGRMSKSCLLYTSPSPRDNPESRMPSSA